MANMYQQPQTQEYEGTYPSAPMFNSTAPYTYGMGQPNPQAMNPQPTGGLPALYPSLQTPQLNPPSGFPGTNAQQQQYAMGGAVDAYMPHYADGGYVGDDSYDHYDYMPHYAQGGLAELAELLKMYQQQGKGMGQMPMSAQMPQGGQREDETVIQASPGELKPHYKKGGLWNRIKQVARFGLPIAGAMIGGPIGAGLGGALGAKLNHKNPWKAGLASAGITAMLPTLGGAIGGAGGFGGGSGLGGLGSLGSMFGGASATAGGAGAAGATAGGDRGAGGLGGLMPWLIGGTLLAGSKAKKKVPDEKQNLQDIMAANRNVWTPEQQHRPVRPTQRVQRLLSPQNIYQEGMPETEYFEDANPPIVHAAQGGYLDGNTGGQDDKIDARLSDGEYVLSADVVGHLGDGNNSAGARKLDKFMANVRNHKTSKRGKGLAPKAKSLSAYMMGR